MSGLVVVVIPIRDAVGTVDATIHSVVSQEGPVHLHVQDGGSTDGSLDRIRQWMTLVTSGRLPGCGAVSMTLSSQSDDGLYDALQRGFAGAGWRADGLMTWIGADDLLAPGALATARSVLDSFPDVGFVTGRPALIDATGRMTDLFPPLPLSRRLLQLGLYEERCLGYLQQEGTVWRRSLWDAVGGVDRSLRLAGDFDLWRRFAARADVMTTEGVLGLHRRRPGQLSHDKTAYFAEIDRIIDPPARQETLNRLRRMAGTIEALRQEGYCGRVAVANTVDGGWQEREHGDFGVFGLTADSHPPPVIAMAGRPPVQSCAARPVDGFGPVEGPYPQWRIYQPVRWLVGDDAQVHLEVRQPGRHRLLIRARCFIPGLQLTVSDGSGHDQTWPLPVTGHETEALLSWTAALTGPVELLSLRVRTETGEPTPQLHKLLMFEFVFYPEQLPDDSV
jgi:hypothetical protein